MGRTGVGKSSFGNQLFGDKLTFAVGHKSTSKTEAISWVSDHFLGTGSCITIIDTPGTKDTEGENCYIVCIVVWGLGRYIFFRQITTLVKVCVAFVFGLWSL